MEVNAVPPPVPVAVAGPLRVELRLGNGQCHSKGCVEGQWHKSLMTPASAEYLECVYTKTALFGLQKRQRIGPSTLKRTTQSLKC